MDGWWRHGVRLDPEAEEYAALVGAAANSVVGLDFDGTLAPIVDDPEAAHIHPDAPDVLADLADPVRAVAVITGRPARQVLALGGLEEVGNAIGETGRELHVFGQYGNERWTSTDRRVVSPRPPHGLATFIERAARPAAPRRRRGAWVEEKGLAVAVHTRRLEDPDAAFDRLLPVLTEVAEEPRARRRAGPQRHRGPRARHGQGRRACARLAEELGAGGFVFAGDDLGDVEAFEAVPALRDEGMPDPPGLLAVREQNALARPGRRRRRRPRRRARPPPAAHPRRRG